jgi:repressor LexA
MLNLKTLSLPLLGEVAAGLPLEKQSYHEFVDVPADLVPRHGENCFVLRVNGDSMKEIGILNKDLVVVEACTWAENGTIVVATTKDFSSTVKRLFHHSNKIELKPENSAYTSQFYALDEISIQGRVVGLIRSY